MPPNRSSTAISTYRQLSPEVLNDLWYALGYTEDPGETSYIQYIVAQWPGSGTLDDYVRLLIRVVHHFTGEDSQGPKGLTLRRTRTRPSTIKQFIDTLTADSSQPFFEDLPLDDANRRKVITDTVLLITGTWTMMQSYFIPHRGDHRRILLAYCLNNGKDFSETASLEQTLPNLLQKCGLLPSPNENKYMGEIAKPASNKADSKALQFALHPSLGSIESLDISAPALNAFKLANLGAVRILWTNNMSRHMLLSKHAKKNYLELFAIPGALQSGPHRMLKEAGISNDLMEEICLSYANLFNPTAPKALHRYVGVLLGAKFWCWCLYCSSKRLQIRQLKVLQSNDPLPGEIRHPDSTRPKYDPALKKLMQTKARGWDQTEFENLWPRIVALDAHLAGAKPWSFWVIFRDRRDSVQFWTFLFGTIILVLTFVQVFLGIAQVVSGFK